MPRLFLIAALSLTPLGPASAQSYNVAETLTDMGRSYCAMSFVRDIGDFDSQPFLRDLVAMNYPQEAFCTCVAAEFRGSGDDEMTAWLLDEIEEESDYALMASFLRAGFVACMPDADFAAAAREDGPGIDLGLEESDLNFTLSDVAAQEDDTGPTIEEVLADNVFPADEGDIQACRMAFDDTMLLPGFDPMDAKARVRQAGQTLDEVCSCAGSYIAALGEPFQAEVEKAMNPATIYGSSLAGGINMCIES
ncbi:hypothetical protein M3484_19865 [Pseudomonas sp. GX19020]|uniref:hypothetical protein n=1 Tax=Pseudomonas sp. GX19020 TaxID=2942277 RepID=UPI002018B567|nr:hypothetical protein [Pseudomonas sp. GX19020]MCL4068821.1 hypothetical protein [Pseudomonas sp. GX19020]